MVVGGECWWVWEVVMLLWLRVASRWCVVVSGGWWSVVEGGGGWLWVIVGGWAVGGGWLEVSGGGWREMVVVGSGLGQPGDGVWCDVCDPRVCYRTLSGSFPI